MIQGINESDISEKLEVSSRGIKNWCNKWRLGVNGSKTELILSNFEKNISVSILNNEVCAITRITKSLGLLIDDKLSYIDHAERVCNKAKRSCDNASRVLGCKWSLAISALVLLYKTIIVPQLLYASAIWFGKNRNTVLRVQNYCIRTIFRHSFSPTTSTCETLLGIPPIDLYNEAIEVKFVIKVIKAKDLVSNTTCFEKYMKITGKEIKVASLSQKSNTLTHQTQ